MNKTVVINRVSVALPLDAVAYKYADPTEDARWLYEEDEARRIAGEDPSLVVWPTEDGAGDAADEVRAAAAAMGRRGGKVGGAARSEAKTAAARANGAKGGRPRSQ